MIPQQQYCTEHAELWVSLTIFLFAFALVDSYCWPLDSNELRMWEMPAIDSVGGFSRETPRCVAPGAQQCAGRGDP